MDKTKTCPKCKEEKPATTEHFYKHKRRRGGLQFWCKVCIEEYKKIYRKANPASHRNSYLKYKYGISSEEYAFLLLGQEGLCAICGKTPQENGKRLAIDHYEENGEKYIRGLLCNDCNIGIGYLHHNIETVEGALEYLIKHK